MPRPSSTPTVTGVGDLLKTLRDPGRNLVDRYHGDPVALAERLGVKLPEKPLVVMQRLGVYDEEKHGPITPGIREFVIEVCLLEEKNVVAVANRGGGKSKGVSFIEFYLWMVEDFECVNIGGSELQADNVYQYIKGYVEDDPFWQNLLREEMQREKSFKITGAWTRVLAASPKSVRSPHAGGDRKVNGKTIERGGLLVIDEEAEAEPEHVKTAFGMVNTAKPSVIARCSTFHKIGGTFQEVIDHAAEMGYKVYKWDIFDVCAGCDCAEGAGCQSEESCFREDHYEDFIDPESGELKQRLLHKAYCNGRAKYASGWIPYSEIVKMWKNFRRDHARFEVEAMGLRPSSKGYVIRDLNEFAANVTTESAKGLYVKGSPVTICVDWGTAAGGVSVWQEQFGGKLVLLQADLLINNNQTQIVGKILEYAKMYRRELVEIAADIGGGGNYLNPELRDVHGLPVRDVVFNTEKEAAVAAWNSFNEANKLVIPAEFKEFIEQVRGWKRQAGRIGKGNDHLCDSAVCFFAKFIDQLGIVKLSVPPVTFSTGGGKVRTEKRDPSEGRFDAMPIAVTIGGGQKRKPR